MEMREEPKARQTDRQTDRQDLDMVTVQRLLRILFLCPRLCVCGRGNSAKVFMKDKVTNGRDDRGTLGEG
ncbi:hypothetical protein E2C01_090418 [Portunus trituberculatus]|uniref:Uncharacterized protein n=1 Tax=Portunus trituberculatus TaxID=210409 RepID=A0A5B7JQ20_PORTR|nr:hypothetical protein [Portunus trituberculatus]